MKQSRKIGKLLCGMFSPHTLSEASCDHAKCVPHVDPFDGWQVRLINDWALLEGWQPRILSILCLRTCQEFNVLHNLLNFGKEAFKKKVKEKEIDAEVVSYSHDVISRVGDPGLKLAQGPVNPVWWEHPRPIYSALTIKNDLRVSPTPGKTVLCFPACCPEQHLPHPRENPSRSPDSVFDVCSLPQLQ